MNINVSKVYNNYMVRTLLSRQLCFGGMVNFNDVVVDFLLANLLVGYIRALLILGDNRGKPRQ